MLTALLPFDVSAFLPTSMLTWVPMLLAGEPVSFVTPVAFAVETAAVVGLRPQPDGAHGALIRCRHDGGSGSREPLPPFRDSGRLRAP